MKNVFPRLKIQLAIFRWFLFLFLLRAEGGLCVCFTKMKSPGDHFSYLLSPEIKSWWVIVSLIIVYLEYLEKVPDWVKLPFSDQGNQDLLDPHSGIGDIGTIPSALSM